MMTKPKNYKTALQGWVKLSDSYNRSTNLELDFKEPTRLKKIYLSSKFQEGLKEIFSSVLEKNSKHRVRVLSGSPGLGKSTFALLVAQIFSKKHPQVVGSLIDRFNKSLRSDFNSFQNLKNAKLLPVFISGYEGDIEQVFKNKLKESLSEEGIVVKKTFSDTLQFYRASLEVLKTKCYSGVFVIYDEFGKYLEKGVHNPTDLNIQFLQNFSEFCDRSGEKQCHLMLITHLSVSRYASQLPTHVQQEWAKIEGRFPESAFYDQHADEYKMIASVFEKNISQTRPALAKKYKTYIKKYLKEFKEEAFEGFIDLQGIHSLLLHCFPLHPSVLSLLPHLSKKVAQNERTLYTFLTRDENHSLKRFLEAHFKNETTLLMPYDLYQYFKLLIAKDIGIGGTYKIQLMTEEAFNRVHKKDEVSKQVISLMALCAVIKDTHFAPLTAGFITSCFNQVFSKSDIEKSLKFLKAQRVVFYNKTTKQYLLQEGTPVDIDEEIAKLKNVTLTGKTLVQILKRYFKTNFIIPKKYNFDHAITRFYRTEMISVEELKSLKTKKNIVDFLREDGRVFYVVPFSHDEMTYAKSVIRGIPSSLTVFVLPVKFIECRKDIEELNAVDCLYNNKEILSASPLVKKELDRHKEVLLTSISSLLRPLIGCMELSVHVIYPKSGYLKSAGCNLRKITHFKELQRYLGNLFEKEYNQYISFNLEYMNRHSVSGSITLARKKFIDLLRKHKKNPSHNIAHLIEGRGPEYVIFNAMLRLSNFKYHGLTNTYQVSQKSPYYKFFEAYQEILSQYPHGICGADLLDILASPPYGLRLGVMPVFMALSDLCFKQPVSHYLDEVYVKELDGDHYDLLMKYPKKTFIHYTTIDDVQQNFLDKLAQMFKAQGVSLHSVIEALLRWRKKIPESTKLSSALSQSGRKLLIQIDSAKEPDKFLFNGIPGCVGKSNIHLKTKKKEITELLSKLQATQIEIEGIYKNLLLKIQNDLSGFIDFIRTKCLNNSFKLMEKDNFIQNFQKTLSQVKDFPLSSHTARFTGRVLNFDSSGYKQYFLETIADVLTGSSPRYWDNKGYSRFEFALKRVQTEIELACEIASPHFKGQSVLAFIDKGKNKKTFVKLGTSFDVNKHLKSSLEKIKMILNTFDETDKRKIILSLIESFDQKHSEFMKYEEGYSREPEIHA